MASGTRVLGQAAARFGRSRAALSTPAPATARKLCSGTGGPAASPEGHEHASSSGARAALLAAAMEQVPTMGWSAEALRAGAESAGLSPAAAGLLERGEAELVEHFHGECDARLAEGLAARAGELEEMALRERLKLAVKLRLEMLGPLLHTWPQAMALQAAPPNAPHALRQRAALVDEIWHLCGDTSASMDWYARRAALGVAYSATEVAMLTDFSPGLEETWGFLDRRVDDVVDGGKNVREAQQLVGAALAALRSSALGGVPGGPFPPRA
mmetsp:Transcript_14097/g.48580  ORF Transcript_14097/g.48580 Transcript_14097/m.48580 type:complete len:270 (-) Transcript_14097:80-889(-)